MDQALQALPCPRGRRPPQPTPGGRRELMWVPPPFDATLEGSPIVGYNTSSSLAPREQYFALLRLGMPQRSLGSRLPNAPVSTTNHEMLAYVLLGRPMSQKYTNPTHFTTPKQHYTARGPHFHAPCTYPIHHGAYRVHLRVCTS